MPPDDPRAAGTLSEFRPTLITVGDVLSGGWCIFKSQAGWCIADVVGAQFVMMAIMAPLLTFVTYLAMTGQQTAESLSVSPR